MSRSPEPYNKFESLKTQKQKKNTIVCKGFWGVEFGIICEGLRGPIFGPRVAKLRLLQHPVIVRDSIHAVYKTRTRNHTFHRHYLYGYHGTEPAYGT